MSIYETSIRALDGSEMDLSQLKGRTVLVVNVASRCGLTPQYAALERLQRRLGDRGFTVLGVPSNQFAGQEPGTPQEIAEFCSTTYGVTFPMTEKVDVNGPTRHPLFDELTAAADADGEAGDVLWNFEKFVVAPDGAVVSRFRPRTDPEAAEVVSVIESLLPSTERGGA